METALFYLFAALTVGCASMVVANPFSRNPVSCGILLAISLDFNAGAAGLQFDSIYEPFYSERIEIVWAVGTNHLPSGFHVFRRVKKEFSPSVVSNLMALGSFAENDLRGSKSSWRVYGDKPSLSHLSFRTDTGAAFFSENAEPDREGEAPGEDTVARLALEMLDRYGIRKSDLSMNEKAQIPECLFIGQTQTKFDKAAGKPVSRVLERGVAFSRVIDGIETTGLGAGRIEFAFGAGLKLRKLQLFDPGLVTVSSHPIATSGQIVQWIREGRARVGSYETTGQRRVEVSLIRKLRIQSVEPAYFFPDVDEPGWREIYPYLRLACEAELGEKDVEDVYLACPAISEGLPKALKTKGDFAVFPSRLYRNIEGSQE